MLFDKIKTEPEFDITKLFAAFFIALGVLTFLVILHIITIESTGDVSSVVGTVFRVFLIIFEGIIILGMAWVIINFLRWLVWQINTPTWKKRKFQGGRK